MNDAAVIEVDRENLLDLLPLITRSIREADFVAIDTEFTGLGHDRNINSKYNG